MSAGTTLDLTKNYRVTLAELTNELVEKLGSELDCLVLYGSIARGDFGPESDIDILLISPDKKIREKASEIRYDIDLKNGTVTSMLDLSPVEIEKYLKMGFPFISHVIEEGKILYDNGTWGRLLNSFTQSV